jgi:beta-xylosidase
VQTPPEKDKLDFVKIKNFYPSKDTNKKVKRRLGAVVHACNSSYGRQKTKGWQFEYSRGKKLLNPISTNKKVGHGGGCWSSQLCRNCK